MTIQELIVKLSKYPPETEVRMEGCWRCVSNSTNGVLLDKDTDAVLITNGNKD